MKEFSLKAKISAIITAVIAGLLAVAIVLVCALYPPFTLTSSSSSKTNSLNSSSNISSSEAASIPSKDTTSATTNTPSVTSPQNMPTDLGSVTPMKSRHEAPKDSDSFDITLSFAGDMILATNKDTYYKNCFNDYAKSQDPSYFLEKVRHVFEADDFTIVNLENVLSDRALTPVTKDYSPAFWFISQASNVNILSGSGVEGTLIANNHIRDYGQAGYDDTVSAITNSGMLYGDNNKIMYFEKGGYVVAVICHGLWSEAQANSIVNLIKVAEQHSHYQVVMFHGGTEKIHTPEEWKKRAARKLVDNGADLVVGGHPHVLQPREVYNGVEIVYSIGNFCYGGHRQPENRTVIYQMTLTIDKDLKLQASNSNMIPCYVYTGNINNFQPAIIEDSDPIKQRILDFMDGKIGSPV